MLHLVRVVSSCLVGPKININMQIEQPQNVLLGQPASRSARTLCYAWAVVKNQDTHWLIKLKNM